MTQFRFTVDSIIDIITNSSTEIFTFPSNDAEKMIRKVVEKVCAAAGRADLKFDDIFNIKTIPSDSVEQDFLYWIQLHKVSEMGCLPDRHLDEKTIQKFFINHPELKEKWMKEWKRTLDYESNPKYRDDIIVTTKEGIPTDIVDNMRAAFDSEEVEN